MLKLSSSLLDGDCICSLGRALKFGELVQYTTPKLSYYPRIMIRADTRSSYSKHISIIEVQISSSLWQVLGVTFKNVEWLVETTFTKHSMQMIDIDKLNLSRWWSSNQVPTIGYSKFHNCFFVDKKVWTVRFKLACRVRSRCLYFFDLLLSHFGKDYNKVSSFFSINLLLGRFCPNASHIGFGLNYLAI